VVPTAGGQRGPDGTFVYVVTDDGHGIVRPIQGEAQDRCQARDREAAQAPERVVTTGLGRPRTAPVEGWTSARSRARLPTISAADPAPWTVAAPQKQGTGDRPGQRQQGDATHRCGAARQAAKRPSKLGQRRGGGAPRARKQAGARRRRRASATPHERILDVIRRPIAKSLLGIAVMMGGMLGLFWLPVASLPQVDFPTIQVTTQLPGSQSDTMASLVTAPLGGNCGLFHSLQHHDLVEARGISRSRCNFDLTREHRFGDQECRPASHAAGSDRLPRTLPYQPKLFHGQPADAPIVTLALTSPTISLRQISDLPTDLLAQRLSELSGVGRSRWRGEKLRPWYGIRTIWRGSPATESPWRTAAIDRRRQMWAGAKDSSTCAHQFLHDAATTRSQRQRLSRRGGDLSQTRSAVFTRDVAEVIDGLEKNKGRRMDQGTPAVIVEFRARPGQRDRHRPGHSKELPRLSARSRRTRALSRHDAHHKSEHRSTTVQFKWLLASRWSSWWVQSSLRNDRATIIAGVALPMSLIADLRGPCGSADQPRQTLSLMGETIGTGSWSTTRS